MLKLLWNNKFTIMLHLVEIALFVITLINVWKADIYVGMLLAILPIVYFIANFEQGGGIK